MDFFGGAAHSDLGTLALGLVIAGVVVFMMYARRA